ncbi:unnamed protein product [Peronospora belbahrii]|uniref:Uncharacterized protein n=1 Tax=Peronospora belbahrii TaxID=622444 RepID=A0AAU9KSZ7_9STRA|nr:unnamed protein product [Peronospora belbahrii]CAH0520456.1 unnamed protein product [Peronospora belbahrii]
MSALEAQKENVYLHSGNGANQDKVVSTPQRGFVIHKDSESTGRKGLEKRSADKRRALGDISNKQRDCQRSNKSDGITSAKKVGAIESVEKEKRKSTKKKIKTPLKTKAVASLEPKTEIKLLRADEVPDVEFAYGGLSSPKSDSAYLKGLHDEIVQDILNDETPTLFDDFDPAHGIDTWCNEKAMLESGKPPSPWWSTELEKTDLQEKVEEQYPVLDDMPPPDDFSNDSLGDLDADQLLEDILSVDVEAVCTE